MALMIHNIPVRRLAQRFNGLEFEGLSPPPQPTSAYTHLLGGGAAYSAASAYDGLHAGLHPPTPPPPRPSNSKPLNFWGARFAFSLEYY